MKSKTMAPKVPGDTPYALRVLDHIRKHLDLYEYRPPPVSYIQYELKLLTGAVRLLFCTRGIDVTAGALRTSLNRCASTLLSISGELFSFASEETGGILPKFHSWGGFRYKTIGTADCVCIVRGFKSDFLITLATAVPDVATLIGLKDEIDYEAARSDRDRLNSILANLEESQRNDSSPAPDPAASRRDVLPTSRHKPTDSAPRQFCVENVTFSSNTCAVNVEVSPTGKEHRTNRLAGIDAQIAVVCHVNGTLWNWKGAGKNFPAAWMKFVTQKEVSQEAIGKLSVFISAPTPPEPKMRTAEGQLLIASTDCDAVTEAASAFLDFRHGAQGSTHEDPRPLIDEIRERRLAMFDRKTVKTSAA